METVTEKSEKLNDRIQAILTRLRPPSPTSHLLCSNEPPTETEHALILNTISQAQAKADRLLVNLTSDSRMLVLARRLAQVNLNKVNKTIVKHRNVLSPIRRIPVEVLEEIFALSIADCEYDEIGSQHFNRRSYSIPKSQSQVCQFWRDVSLSNPKLWSRIPTIDLDSAYPRDPAFLGFLADILARRCRDVPINFHIISDSKSESFKPHPAVSILVSHSTKWSTAILGVSWFKESELLQIKGRVPQLETLALSFLNWYPGSPRVIDVFQLAPQLREVIFVNGNSPVAFLLPQHQLLLYRHNSHHYRYYDGVTHDVENLSNFTSLRKLEIGRLYHPGIGNTRARLTNLTMLKLKITCGNNQLHFLERLILPALKDLSVSSLSPDLLPGIHVSIMSVIIDLILRSGIPSLERLHIQSRSREEAGVLTLLLHHTPLITHLNIHLPPVEDLTRLVQAVDGNGITPLLQVCTFYSEEKLDDREADLCRQLALRRCEVPINHHGPIHRLRALYIESKDPFWRWDDDSVFSQTRVLHGWAENTVTAYLKAYCGALGSHFNGRCQVRRPINYDRRSLPPGKNYYSRVILSILSAIEQMEITRAEDLYASAVFRMLYRLTNNRKKKYYTQLSQRILEKWNPLIESSLDQVHWAICENRIFYVPSDSSFRRSSDSMTKLLLQEFDKDIPDVDCPWPPKDVNFF